MVLLFVVVVVLVNIVNVIGDSTATLMLIGELVPISTGVTSACDLYPTDTRHRP